MLSSGSFSKNKFQDSKIKGQYDFEHYLKKLRQVSLSSFELHFREKTAKKQRTDKFE